MMNNLKFLYGAAVQGIQSFIFQTNELKDIAGASELVEKICTDYFTEFVGRGQLLVNAAGNIKCIFNDEETCRRAVREFPKKVMTSAPGITISEAVVKMDSTMDFEEAVELLEQRLRSQRNKPFASITTGFMGIERSRKTGLPAVRVDGDEYVDMATEKKRKNSQLKNSESTVQSLIKKAFDISEVEEKCIAFQLEKMVDINNWLAVIHADGNGLGHVVSKIGRNGKLLKSFSEGLDEATTIASRKAYSDVLKSEKYRPVDNVIPFRPVVLGGDDMTMICRADLAVDYTRFFLSHFEKETETLMSNLHKVDPTMDVSYLTACAGIAFVKASYPFYYGYQLAETLCERAKKDADRKASCLMYHKVQSSFVENYDEIVRKELVPCEGCSFEFGPYYLKEKAGRWTIEELCGTVAKLEGKNGNAVKSDIREWMTLMNDGIEKAHQKEERVHAIITNIKEISLFEKATIPTVRNGENRYAAYDLLALHTILSQVTKEK